jgi:hypothetical protein
VLPNLVSVKNLKIVHNIYRKIGIIFFQIYKISQIQMGLSRPLIDY